MVLAPVAGVKSRGGFVGPTGRAKPSIRGATVTKRNSSPGRARRNPLKPLRREGRMIPATPVVRTACFLLHAGHGCGGHPAFPAPSSCRGTRFSHQLGARSACEGRAVSGWAERSRRQAFPVREIAGNPSFTVFSTAPICAYVAGTASRGCCLLRSEGNLVAVLLLTRYVKIGRRQNCAKRPGAFF